MTSSILLVPFWLKFAVYILGSVSIVDWLYHIVVWLWTREWPEEWFL